MPKGNPHIELDVLSRVAAGDEQALGQLFHAYYQELAEYIFLLTRSMPLTEEIVQDTFTKLWQHRERLITVTNFRSYLFTISRNHAFNCLRGLAREAQNRRKWTAHFVHAHYEEQVEEQTQRRQQYYQLIEEAVGLLPPQQQRAYLLSRQDGLSHDAIGRAMQLSRETVKRHITLALRAIKEYVRSHAGRILIGIALILTN
ncbi:MAG TPA: sigma-70 family RNA polymerase sigma factor [Puia sp.]|nr:sigma-70 family RNA polymerase sigma factor [Puia sp.]